MVTTRSMITFGTGMTDRQACGVASFLLFLWALLWTWEGFAGYRPSREVIVPLYLIADQSSSESQVFKERLIARALEGEAFVALDGLIYDFPEATRLMLRLDQKSDYVEGLEEPFRFGLVSMMKVFLETEEILRASRVEGNTIVGFDEERYSIALHSFGTLTSIHSVIQQLWDLYFDQNEEKMKSPGYSNIVSWMESLRVHGHGSTFEAHVDPVRFLVFLRGLILLYVDFMTSEPYRSQQKSPEQLDLVERWFDWGDGSVPRWRELFMESPVWIGWRDPAFAEHLVKIYYRAKKEELPIYVFIAPKHLEGVSKILKRRLGGLIRLERFDSGFPDLPIQNEWADTECDRLVAEST